MEEGTVRVVSVCPRCGARDEFELPKAGFEARRKGVPIRRAFPDIPEYRVRQLAEHLCRACQEGGEG